MATIPEILQGHVTLEVESVDRLYLNGYVPSLSTPGGLTTFIREHLDKLRKGDRELRKRKGETEALVASTLGSNAS